MIDVRRKFRGYSGARPDVVRLVRDAPRRVLDVGCGAGMTSALLKSKHAGCVVVGVEPDPHLAREARSRVDEVIESPIDADVTLGLLAGREKFDLVICADVLEHLVDPWTVLRSLVALLSDEGSLITSIPNVRHVSTFISLGLFGRWPRRERGIHDRTHLRFFARADILELGRASRLVPLKEARNLRLAESAAWTLVPARVLDFWPFRPFLTFQYLHLWRKPDAER